MPLKVSGFMRSRCSFTMTEAQEFFKKAVLFTDDVEYVMVSLPARAITLAAAILAEINDPFGCLIVDKDEVTLTIPAECLEDYRERLRHAHFSEPMRLITFDIVLPPTLTGFMAFVADLLAQAKIPIIPIGAYHRDHLLVSAEHFQKAWQLLKDKQQA